MKKNNRKLFAAIQEVESGMRNVTKEHLELIKKYNPEFYSSYKTLINKLSLRKNEMLKELPKWCVIESTIFELIDVTAIEEHGLTVLLSEVGTKKPTTIEKGYNVTTHLNLSSVSRILKIKGLLNTEITQQSVKTSLLLKNEFVTKKIVLKLESNTKFILVKKSKLVPSFGVNKIEYFDGLPLNVPIPM